MDILGDAISEIGRLTAENEQLCEHIETLEAELNRLQSLYQDLLDAKGEA